MKLSANQVCPIHRRRDCCGRESAAQRPKSAKWIEIGPGIRKHKETGLVRRSPAELACEEGSGTGQPVLALREGIYRRAGDHAGTYTARDDSESNITAAHAICNGIKGSRRLRDA